MNNRREFLDRAIQVGAAVLAAPVLARANAEAVTDVRYPIGCYTRPWAKYDYRVAFDDIAAAGFKNVGLMSTNNVARQVLHVKLTDDEAAQIGHEARSRGLEIPSAWSGDFGVARSIEAGMTGLRHLIDVAAIASVKNLLLGGIGNQKLYERYYKVVAECCDYAAQKSVGLTIKPHGGLNGTGRELRKCVELVGRNNFRIWYDAGNIYYYSDGKISPLEDAPSVAGLVSGWCIKDFTDKPTKSVDLTPGTGNVDFAAVFAELKKGGFAGGPLVIETLTPGDRPQLKEQAAKARKLLEGMTA
jgi:sugar phosphate isomerase/epimerase